MFKTIGKITMGILSVLGFTTILGAFVFYFEHFDEHWTD